jgi:hypothetical protein
MRWWRQACPDLFLEPGERNSAAWGRREPEISAADNSPDLRTHSYIDMIGFRPELDGRAGESSTY